MQLRKGGCRRRTRLIGSNYENEQQEKGEKGVRITRSVTYPSFSPKNRREGYLKI